MVEHPIIFSASMVRAIMQGRKTQTRRIVKRQFALDATPVEVSATTAEGWQTFGHSGLWWDDGGAAFEDAIRCPFGIPGDRLWVRESCRAEELSSGLDGVRYLADNVFIEIANTPQAADQWGVLNTYRGMICTTIPSIHMPRWASRILLEITDIRIQRLNDISKQDAKVEGINWLGSGFERRHPDPEDVNHTGTTQDTRLSFMGLWEQINGEGSWAANPWVWVVEFKRVQS